MNRGEHVAPLGEHSAVYRLLLAPRARSHSTGTSASPSTSKHNQTQPKPPSLCWRLLQIVPRLLICVTCGQLIKEKGTNLMFGKAEGSLNSNAEAGDLSSNNQTSAHARTFAPEQQQNARQGQWGILPAALCNEQLLMLERKD